MSQSPGESTRLGSYRIIAELARGGMAAVFLALNESPGGRREVVAIKQIHPHLAHDPDFVAMLMDEARLASKVHHPNVVEIKDYALGHADGKNYIVMEYADGEALSMLLKHAIQRGTRLSPALAASIAADTAGALHAAHELTDAEGRPLGLVHRDVSPQNVIVTYDGRVKLTDFGVAKAVGRLQRTQPGEIKGKLAYMAPEQAYGREVDRRSDVYSLGVVLYELALGRRLFGGKSDAETVRNVMEHKITRPREVDPSFPEALEQVILAMLAQDPTERFQTAGAAERALRALATSEGPPELVAQRLGEFVRGLDPDRFRAKRALVEKSLSSPPAHPLHDGADPPTLVDAARSRAPTRSPPPPRPALGEDDGALARTMVSSRPPPRPQPVTVAREPAVDPTVQANITPELAEEFRRASMAPRPSVPTPSAPPAPSAHPAPAPPPSRSHAWLWALIGVALLVLGAATLVVVSRLG